jgi:hypothetical protein
MSVSKMLARQGQGGVGAVGDVAGRSEVFEKALCDPTAVGVVVDHQHMQTGQIAWPPVVVRCRLVGASRWDTEVER